MAKILLQEIFFALLPCMHKSYNIYVIEFRDIIIDVLFLDTMCERK
jgi:hypothetical protein